MPVNHHGRNEKSYNLAQNYLNLPKKLKGQKELQLGLLGSDVTGFAVPAKSQEP